MTTTIRAFDIRSVSIGGPVRHERLNMTEQERKSGLSDHFYSCTIIAVDDTGHAIELNMTSNSRDAFTFDRF